MGTIESDLPALYLAGESPAGRSAGRPAGLPEGLPEGAPEGMSVGGLVELPEEEARHVRALRLRPGDRVLLLDGRGGRAEGSLEVLGKRSVRVRVTSSKLVREEGRPYIALGLGLISDKSRFEWCIEKSVELGVREIVPIVTERSQGRFHRDRAERIAVSALKQSQRSFLPHFREVTPFDRLPELRQDLPTEPAGSFDLVCICHEKVPPEQSLAAILSARADGRPPERLLLLIGPEGGFSDREVEAAVSAGALAVSISDARLRSETAALVAAAVAKSLLLVAN